ncbi:hypothetical protein CLOBY_06510 [Clostridium saccharobutylicum]|nr:hypothetical protein CLOBY_06510 [Clostridium saccharobutylicum]NSB87786.1 hypothetical protein [Clostridium saccharobutylicum]NYC29120.1 hypothetical protein [Clostridium saccharobutylicum]OAV41304.1 hypothetical protein M945_1259 [Clostridium saccharobutylicum DSM 13864]OOM13245.1 hypothetical protein CLSAB_34470 [Clostridium saccharobutylicum]
MCSVTLKILIAMLLRLYVVPHVLVHNIFVKQALWAQLAVLEASIKIFSNRNKCMTSISVSYYTNLSLDFDIYSILFFIMPYLIKNISVKSNMQLHIHMTNRDIFNVI